MDIKTLIIKNNKITFETELKKYIENGYKIISSDIKIIIRHEIIGVFNDDFYYYALLQKD